MLKPTAKHRSESGQSMVELALGIVVLLILLAAIIDLGRLLFFSISLRDATQEGAVVGTLNPSDCQNVISRIRSVLGAGPNDTNIGVNIQVSTAANPDTYINVCVNNVPPATNFGCSPNNLKIITSTNFKFVMPFLSGQTIPLSNTITGTILRPPCP